MSFKEAVEFSLQWEGGYVNDPTDPGGETKWGISKRAFPNEDIKNLTKERAMEIYYNRYWVAAGCDSLARGIGIAVFDTAVNCGVTRAKSWLTPDDTVRSYLEKRMIYYGNLIKRKPALTKYIKGWTNRVVDLRKYIDILEHQ